MAAGGGLGFVEWGKINRIWIYWDYRVYTNSIFTCLFLIFWLRVRFRTDLALVLFMAA